eukprot:2245460-Pyramimonas_sp.AAC.2
MSYPTHLQPLAHFEVLVTGAEVPLVRLHLRPHALRQLRRQPLQRVGIARCLAAQPRARPLLGTLGFRKVSEGFGPAPQLTHGPPPQPYDGRFPLPSSRRSHQMRGWFGTTYAVLRIRFGLFISRALRGPYASSNADGPQNLATPPPRVA